MKSLKKFFVFLLISVSLSTSAQQVKVVEESYRIKGDNVDGFGVELEGKQDEIVTAFNKYLRSFAVKAVPTYS